MKECYGTIYPDMSQFRFGKELPGKVFRMRIDTLGPGHRDRHLDADLPAWQACQECGEFRGCYDFSNAKLAMQQAVSAI
jgi:hypothetical protein